MSLVLYLELAHKESLRDFISNSFILWGVVRIDSLFPYPFEKLAVSNGCINLFGRAPYFSNLDLAQILTIAHENGQVKAAAWALKKLLVHPLVPDIPAIISTGNFFSLPDSLKKVVRASDYSLDAIRSGHVDTLRQLVRVSSINLDIGFQYSSLEGVKYFLSLGRPSAPVSILEQVCKKGSFDMVKYICDEFKVKVTLGCFRLAFANPKLQNELDFYDLLLSYSVPEVSQPRMDDLLSFEILKLVSSLPVIERLFSVFKLPSQPRHFSIALQNHSLSPPVLRWLFFSHNLPRRDAQSLLKIACKNRDISAALCAFELGAQTRVADLEAMFLRSASLLQRANFLRHLIKGLGGNFKQARNRRDLSTAVACLLRYGYLEAVEAVVRRIKKKFHQKSCLEETRDLLSLLPLHYRTEEVSSAVICLDNHFLFSDLRGLKYPRGPAVIIEGLLSLVSPFSLHQAFGRVVFPDDLRATIIISLLSRHLKGSTKWPYLNKIRSSIVSIHTLFNVPLPTQEQISSLSAEQLSRLQNFDFFGKLLDSKIEFR